MNGSGSLVDEGKAYKLKISVETGLECDIWYLFKRYKKNDKTFILRRQTLHVDLYGK